MTRDETRPPDVTWLGADPPPRPNPYLDYLEEALVSLGVRVVHGGEGFRWRHLLSPRPLPRVFHLHWLNTVHTGGTSWDTFRLSASYLAKILLVRLRGRRLVWTVHNLLPHYRATLADRLCRRATAQLATGLIVHNDSARELVERRWRPRRRPTVALMGRYDGRYGPKALREASRDRLGLPREPLLFLIFGQLRGNKQIDRLVALFSRLDPDRFHLLLSGTRSSRDALAGCREIVESAPNIHLREGFVPDADVPFLFGATDGFVFAGDEILSTSSVVLALSYGIPILAPDLACLRGVVPAQARVQLDVDDPEGARAALEALDRAALAARGRAAFDAMQARTWLEAARVHLTVYGLDG